ncbi:hypothetical protein [Pedobacter sp. Hv1]|uniref:hypothetical protein n=1 Tax=Pedobacter sp. Hv1 TaxID=1740090 RepID=UPI0006D8C643|nr:hypothetical protein [Pedobacter sp. Hv1]KQB99197.1 hypothetical protein AQF98_16595 [Pedobacter sp. Hv1]
MKHKPFLWSLLFYLIFFLFGTTFAQVSQKDQTISFEVDSYTRKTDLQLRIGDRLKIEASGKISLGFFAGYGGVEGIEGYKDYCIEPNFRHGALLYRIGNGPWQLLGSELSTTAKTGGILQFMVNDNDPGNNSGVFNVSIQTNGIHTNTISSTNPTSKNPDKVRQSSKTTQGKKMSISLQELQTLIGSNKTVINDILKPKGYFKEYNENGFISYTAQEIEDYSKPLISSFLKDPKKNRIGYSSNVPYSYDLIKLSLGKLGYKLRKHIAEQNRFEYQNSKYYLDIVIEEVRETNGFQYSKYSFGMGSL